MIKIAFIALGLLASTTHAWQAKVVELGTRQGLSGAVVMDLSGTVLAETGADGSFSLLTPPAEVKILADGFAAKTLEPGPARVDLVRTIVTSAEFKVVAAKDRELGRSGIQGSKLRKVAGAGGDAFRAVLTLPGVIAVGDFSGNFGARGGGPEDNRIFLDGIPWPVPFHFGGVMTTVPSELLDSVDLFNGGFPARLGNADGAVIEAKTRPGNSQHFKGRADLNLVTASVFTEGPLGLSGKSSWQLYGRRSYFDLILPRVMNLNFTALPAFYDTGFNLNWEPNPANRIRLLSLLTDDILSVVLTAETTRDPEFQGELRFRNRYWTTGLNWENRSLANLTLKSWIYFYRVSFGQAFGKGYFVDNAPQVLGLKEEAEWELGRHRVGLGGSVEWVNQNVRGFAFRRAAGNGSGSVTVSDPAGITVSAELRQGAVYLQDRINLTDNLHLTLGLRYDRGAHAVESLTPRVNAEWLLGPWTLRSAWGIYAQLPSARELAPDFGNPSLSMNLTEHILAGIERRFGKSVTARLEAYHKIYRNRVVEVPDSRLYSNDGEGHASGAEFYLNWDDNHRHFGWLSYAYALSERKESLTKPWRPYRYDQPHVATLVTGMRVTPSFDLSGTLRYHTGGLITPIAGAIYDSSKDQYYPVYSDLYSDRLTDYVRLDLKAEYKWNYPLWNLSFYLEIINATDHANPAGRDYNKSYTAYKDVRNLPRLPYFGITAEY